MKYKSNLVIKSLSYKFAEQLLTKGMSLVISIVLARLLDVEAFGTIAILTVFTNLCSAVIEGGLSTSLIQKKEVDNKDYSTVFYTSALLAVALYSVLFVCAPYIESIYGTQRLCVYIRVLGLLLFITPFNSTQLGYVYRNMMFKQLFISTVTASVVSGTVGIVMAVSGFGVWALIGQNLSHSTVSVLMLAVLTPWRLTRQFSYKRLKEHFSYGWKLLISSVVDTLYIDVQALVIGKKYSDADLAYYNRGEAYPKTVMTSLNTAVQSVMLPVMSSEQSNKEAVKAIMRKTVSLSAFLLFPVMAGFAGVAKNFVIIVLTEKWLPCVLFLQLACVVHAIRPINSCNLQAIKAIGRSDIFLALTLIKKSIGIAIIFLTAFCFKTPLAIAIGVALYAPVELIINAIPNAKLVGYTIFEQLKDIALPMIMSVIMFAAVCALSDITANVWVNSLVQVIAGVAIYAVLAFAFRVKAMTDVMEKIKRIIKR